MIWLLSKYPGQYIILVSGYTSLMYTMSTSTDSKDLCMYMHMRSPSLEENGFA